MDEKHIKMIERIHNELVGDPYTEGLIPEHKKLKTKVDQHEVLIRATIAGGCLFAFVLGVWLKVKGLF